MLKILDRYITKELLGPFMYGIAAFSSILAGSTVLFPLVGEGVKYSIPVWDVIQLFIYKMPSIIVFTFPMSMLLATILSFGRLNSDLEIIAFRASGISFIRLVIPVIIIGLLVSIMTIWFSESIVPKASNSAEELLRSYTHQKRPALKKNVNITEYDSEGEPMRITNVRSIEKELLQDITVAEFENARLTRVIRADTGQWLPTGGWEFYSGVMHHFPSNDKHKLLYIEFEKEFIDIRINPFDMTKRSKKAEEMTASELKEQIELKHQTGEDPTKDIMNYHLKFSVPFASLIFAILGASVGLRPYRSSSTFGLGMSLVVILIYYVLLSISMGFGLSRAIPAVLAAWIPNILIGSTGLYLLERNSKR
ncbi:LptF/LptG family permease [Thermoproteota archaeon]